MKSDLIKTILELEQRQVITKVEAPTDWISHLQPVRKPNGKIRICIDPQNLNQAIKRNHAVMPTLEDVLSQLNGAKFFPCVTPKKVSIKFP